MDSDLNLDELLERARRAIVRLTPADAQAAQHSGALMIDIRPEAQRRRDGEIDGALVIDRNVLEWRLAPTSRWRVAEASDPGRQVILLCNQGFQSSLAAYTLLQLGMTNVADVVGGAEAWLAAGLPVEKAAGGSAGS